MILHGDVVAVLLGEIGLLLGRSCSCLLLLLLLLLLELNADELLLGWLLHDPLWRLGRDAALLVLLLWLRCL